MADQTLARIISKLDGIDQKLDAAIERMPRRREHVSLQDGMQKTFGSFPDMTKRLDWNKQVGWINVTKDVIADWEAAYPSVNVDDELKKAHAWLKANPKRAGKRDWLRFATAWLARAHDIPRQGGGYVAQQGRAEGRREALERVVTERQQAESETRSKAAKPEFIAGFWRDMKSGSTPSGE